MTSVVAKTTLFRNCDWIDRTLAQKFVRLFPLPPKASKPA